MTGEDGTFNLQKIAMLRGSGRGAVLSGGLLAFLLLLPQAVTAAPGPAGGPGKGLTAGQAGSARQGARVQASREVEAGSNPDPLPDKAEDAVLRLRHRSYFHWFVLYVAALASDGSYLGYRPLDYGTKTVDMTNYTSQGRSSAREPKAQTFTYLYEASFPEPGDFDYNDVVMRVTKSYGLASYVVLLTVKLEAVGIRKQVAAGIHLGGVKYDDIYKVELVSRQKLDNDYPMPRRYIQSNDHLMRGRNGEAVINVLEDAHWAMLKNRASDGSITRMELNTSHDLTPGVAEQAEPVTVTYQISFKSPEQARCLTFDRIDPFIVEEYNGGLWEVHTYRYKFNDVLYNIFRGNQNAYDNHVSWCVTVPKGDFRYSIEGMPLGTYNKEFDLVQKLCDIYHKLNDKDGLVKYCLGVHAEYTLGEGELEKVVEACHLLKAPFYTHISETEKEVRECYEKRGMSPVQYFEKMGAYYYGGGGYHCCYFSDEDIQIFKKHGCSVVTCPGSNTKLASGIAPISKYLENGLNVAIGTDGPASNNSLDMFKEMTLVYALQKVSLKDPSALPAFEVLKMATVNGARAMGLYDSDVLDVGKKADLIEIDLSKPNMQPINNIINNIVYAGSKDNIKMTMINGKILYKNGKFYTKEKPAKIYEKCQKISERIEKELEY